MAVGDGIFDKVGNEPVQSGSLLSLLPSLLIHGAVVLVIWLGLSEGDQVQPPVTFISLAPAAAPAPEELLPAPSVAAPDLEPEFEPLPLPATGIALPQPEPPAAPPEPVVDFAPPDLPEPESFPFDPKATRVAEPEPVDAVALKNAEEKPKPKETKKKPEKPKKKQSKKAAAPAVAEKQAVPAPAAAPSPSSTPAQDSPAAQSKPAPAANQSAAISDVPVRVTNPNYAGACSISYPERARRRNQEGTVVVHALIGPDGKPIEVSVAQSSGHRLLDQAAQEAIANCAFVPQKVGGRTVRAIVEIPIPFKLI
ncbi:energy transducer TonB [Dongia sp.]|uniref:energy transducer TonB n=1 Tax=Dongia sp. TaxID=1977262 RepID=UPI003753922A